MKAVEIENHRVKGAINDPIPGGSPMETRRCVVIHFTGGASGESSVEAMKQRGVSAHVVVERDGTVRQCRPFNVTCGHAGKQGQARWQDPKTGERFGTPNNYAIGIEIANAGDEASVFPWAARHGGVGTVRLAHRNGGPEKEWEAFTPAQIETVTALCKALCSRYKLDDITGHDCVAPERKNDPGPAFPMDQLRADCGFGKTLPKVHKLR